MSGVVVDGLRWEVRVRGAGDPLLLLHGFTGRGSSWGAHATALAREFRVIVVDLPGHGRSGIPSDPARASVERSADDLAEILVRERCAPAHVLGYSLGARIALRLAATHPAFVRRLVLESPSAGLASDPERARRRAADDGRAARLERDGIDAFVEEWEKEPVLASLRDLPAASAERLRVERRRNRAAGLATSLRGAGQGSMEPLHDRLGGIRAPTLVITGSLDATGRSRAEEVVRRVRGARLAVIAGAGHRPHLESPAAFRSLVMSFLKENSVA